MSGERNVLGGPLEDCSHDPLTGFNRDGCCRVTEEDVGVHSVCVRVTEDFLRFSRQRGNDLTTAHPEYGFPGLGPGDRWCLCAARWQEAYDAGCAPPVILEATSSATLEIVSLDALQEHSIPNLKAVS